MNQIDLNADVGESFGQYQLGDDAALMTAITSANIACGFHAGDPGVMRRTVALAANNGVAIGAHPGYPDLVGFGRRDMSLSAEELQDIIMYQIGALMALARAAGIPLNHVKPHGALYNRLADDAALATACARAVAAVDQSLILVGLAGSELVRAGRSAGLRVAGEAFADRAYDGRGRLLPRSRPGAVYHRLEDVLRQVERLAREKSVRTAQGDLMEIEADTICLHGDTPGAAQMATAVRRHLESCGVRVAPMGEWL